MLTDVHNLILGLIGNLVFVLLTLLYRRIWNSRKRSRSTDHRSARIETSRLPAYDGDTPYSYSDLLSNDPLSERRRFDLESLGCVIGLCVTLVVPFIIGATILSIIAYINDCGTPFSGTSCPPLITSQMMQHSREGSVEYWLGVAVISTIEIGILLLPPWRGRIIGVCLGILLAAITILFAIPASRGESFLFGS